MRFPVCILLATALFFCCVTAQAETRYVVDQLIVTVRSNKTNNYEVLTTLLTDSPVTILDEDKTFFKVKTEKGIEGYILKQYITKAIPKKTQIAQLKNQLTALEEKLKKQQLEYQNATGMATSSQATIEQLTNDLEQTMQQLKKINNEYAELKQSADNVIGLTNERDQLLEENTQINGQLAVLKEENENFHRTNMIQWFLAGGGVFFVGWLSGKISRKKRGFSRI